MIMHIGCSLTYAQYNAESNPGEYLNLRRGAVVDDYGNPLADVQIHIKGQDRTAVSNGSGYFEIEAPGNSVLVFRHPGFDTYQLKVDGSKHLAVGEADSSNIADSELGDDPGEIDKYLPSQMTGDYLPVRMTGRYLKDPDRINTLHGTVNPGTSVGSVSSVYNEHLSTTLAPSYAYALPGRLAGLYTEQYSGFGRAEITTSSEIGFGQVPISGVEEPTDNTEMTLSLRGQNPVVIIDGMQRSIFSVDPANIESISVQKDALSSIVLGLRSSRGVLLVTTKEPQSDRLRMSFTAQTGMQRSLNMPEPLPAYQHAYLMNEALQNDGRRRAYTAEDFGALRSGSDSYRHPDVNWYDQLLRDQALMSNYSLNVSDGGEVVRYFVSLNYLNQEGMFKTSDLNSYNTNAEQDRYIINSKVNVDVMEDFTVGLQLFGRIKDGNQPGATTNGLLNGIYTTPGSAYPVLNPDGSYGGDDTYTTNLASRALNSGYIQDNSRDVMINLDLDYNLDDLLEGLSAKATSHFATQAAIALYRNKQSPVFEMSVNNAGDTTYTQYGSSSPQSNDYVSTRNSRFWYMQSALEYDNRFGKHGTGISLMADRRDVTLNYDLPDVTVNYTARGNYSYDTRYFAEAAVNYSGYNGYEPGHQYGLFYAFGLGWDIAGENFIKNNVPWLNQLKIRGVYGRTGNGVENSDYYIWRAETYTGLTGTYPLGTDRSDDFNDGWVSNGLSNPNITWEKADKISAGVDISLFNDRLQLTGDYYHDEYFDLLQQRGSPLAFMGLAYPIENIGRTLYRGVDLSLTYQNNAGNFNYFFSGNWSITDSEVLYMDEQEREYEWNKRTGRPAGTRFGLVADGFFDSVEEIEQSAIVQGLEAQPGDVKYKDLNKDGIIDQFDMAPIAGDKPLSYFGLTAGFSFKGFDFSVLLQGTYNRDIYVPRHSFEGDGTGQGYEYILGRWTPATAETATFPRLSTEGDTYNYSPNFLSTSFWVKSGNYIRVKNVSLKYTMPYAWTHRAGLSEVKLFVNALNLFTVADYDRVDPEAYHFPAYAPLQQVISTGINIKL